MHTTPCIQYQIPRKSCTARTTERYPAHNPRLINMKHFASIKHFFDETLSIFDTHPFGDIYNYNITDQYLNLKT